MTDRPLRIFTAILETETNTFSPLATGMRSFERNQILRGTAKLSPDTEHGRRMLAWRLAGTRDGHHVIESIAAIAQPAGRVLQSVYELLRDELLNDLRAALPVDVVLLGLHGAMAATDEDDCEGDILQRVRQIVGADVAVGAELDLHCHVSTKMVDNATAIVTYKEFPHDDIIAMANELYVICIAAARGETRPVMAIYDCRIIGLWPTTREPVKSFVDHMRRAECEGILSVSLAHGFPYADVADVGAKMVVIADGDMERARQCAAKFGRAFWDLRAAARWDAVPIDEGLDAALAAAQGPVVLADSADNAGGGAPGDSTFVLRRMLERGISNAASAIYYDPMSVDLCFEAGVGSTIDLRFGGKLGVTSGVPLDVRASVRGLRSDHEQHGLIGPVSLGRSAWIEVEGIDVVLASERAQTYAPNAFTGVGIELSTKQIIVVKSTHHFYHHFGGLASRVIHLAAPGTLRSDFENIPYTKRDSRYWPRLDDPFTGEC